MGKVDSQLLPGYDEEYSSDDPHIPEVVREADPTETRQPLFFTRWRAILRNLITRKNNASNS